MFPSEELDNYNPILGLAYLKKFCPLEILKTSLLENPF